MKLERLEHTTHTMKLKPCPHCWAVHDRQTLLSYSVSIHKLGRVSGRHGGDVRSDEMMGKLEQAAACECA